MTTFAGRKDEGARSDDARSGSEGRGIGALEELSISLEASKRIRESDQPVRFDELSQTWGAYGYDDVQEIVRAPHLYSNTPPGATYTAQQAMVFTDPPRHDQLRKLVVRAFTPGSVTKLGPRAYLVVDQLLADVVTGESFDVISALADPFPVIMIAEMLGVDLEARQEFKRWSHAFSVVGVSQAHASNPQHSVEMMALNEMLDYFGGVIDRRLREPGDDLITRLAFAEVDGVRLARDELTAACAQLLAAGNETTTNLIGNAVICLARYPSILERLRDDNTLIPAFIEEVLRFLAPVQYVPRYTTERVHLGSAVIDEGSVVLVHLASANRDATRFKSPDTFDVDREMNRHLTLGSGIHFCVGAALARLEGRIAVERLLAACPGPWVVPDHLARLKDEPFFFGVRSLPLTSGRGS